MPSFLTHYDFGKEIEKKITSKDYMNLLSRHSACYHLGLQGPDLFFFYLNNYISPNFRNIGHIMHHENTKAFLTQAISHIEKQTKKEEKEILMAYISGFLCHYTLDCTCHPYIYARTNYTKLKSQKLKYFSYHSYFETIVDTNMHYHLTGKLPSSIHTYDTIRLSATERDVIGNFLSQVLNQVYYNGSITIKPRNIKAAIHSTFLMQRLLDNRYKWKKNLLSRIDKRIFGYPLLSFLIPSDRMHNNLDCLNKKKKIWYSPWEQDTPRDQSFLDLFALSLEKASVLLTLLSTIEEDKTAKQTLENLILDVSYSSGK